MAAVLKTDIPTLRFNCTEFVDGAGFLPFLERTICIVIVRSQNHPREDCRLLTLVICSYELGNISMAVVIR